MSAPARCGHGTWSGQVSEESGCWDCHIKMLRESGDEARAARLEELKAQRAEHALRDWPSLVHMFLLEYEKDYQTGRRPRRF